MHGPKAVTGRLDAEQATGRLTFDASQHAAAKRLDALAASLAAAPSGPLRRLRATWPRFGAAAARASPQGLYLWGGVGRGKTLLMDMFFASLEAAGRPAAERSHFYRFMRTVHAELGAIKDQAEPLDRVAERMAARTQIICLDEFFVADIADAMILGGLFTGLFRRGVVLVATSNVPPDALYKDGLQRQRFLPAIALLQAHLEVLHLDGRIDYRLRQLERAPTYLDSTAGATAAALAARFAALAGGHASGAVKLDVEGRGLDALGTGPGLAWFEFRALCQGARSQNDYIELARLFHTVFVSDVPVFEATDDDAARRFIMLIDELYDRGVKLVLSAAAAPTSLYRGERLRFEFERAASRLIEMQTQQYLAGQHRP